MPWKPRQSAGSLSWSTSGTVLGRTYQELLQKMQPGDIHTHVYAQQFPILNDNNQPADFMFEARDRGIIFDLGHGAGSFWFRLAIPAFQGGFAPDSISTDLHIGNVNGVVHDMLTTMSKLLCMGMPLKEVIYRSTVTPAQEINHPELGHLSVGAEADIAILKQREGFLWLCRLWKRPHERGPQTNLRNDHSRR